VMCTSCAWAKPAKPHPFEFCENGAKATLWELTTRRATPDFFARHRVTQLLSWSDHDLEQAGRLTHPMRYDAATDRYQPCGWDEAFAAIGGELKAIDPKSAVFYTSGRASLETSYLWALFARAYGHNNLPDSSNMCHETTGFALGASIGVAVGTATLDDFDHCDAIFFFGQNTGTNSPRFLHTLQKAVERGCRIVTFNPLRERGLEKFVNPQSPLQMLTQDATTISSEYYQVKAGGDIAVLAGMAKCVIEADALDRAFIAEHTHGFDAWVAFVEAQSWTDIEAASGLTREQITQAARTYCGAKAVIGIYGMGLTQHVGGFDNVTSFVNLLLMRGNIGRRGAGISPVRGHSNVQGQRTVGIADDPKKVPLSQLRDLFGFDPPSEKGMNTVETCRGVLDGSVRAFIGLGGNFLRAVPDSPAVEAKWRDLALTVQIATKLNRSHLVNGRVAYLLPCLGRFERDVQASGEQAVSMEDSLSHIHGSLGRHPPASRHLRSELAIVAGIAKATLAPRATLKWDEWTADYAKVRDLIEATYPDQFRAFNARLFTPGGFYRGNAARERHWKTPSGKAQFTLPQALTSTGFAEAPGRFRLITLRSNDQFNTTIYGNRDRLRGINGRRDVVLVSPTEMAKHGLAAGQRIALQTDRDDGVIRRVDRLEVVAFDLPEGCLGAYYPEANPLVPLDHHDRESSTPAYKSVPVRIIT
jgi:molybdopterin-dependent oxidoreductase alpha subunit